MPVFFYKFLANRSSFIVKYLNRLLCVAFSFVALIVLSGTAFAQAISPTALNAHFKSIGIDAFVLEKNFHAGEGWGIVLMIPPGTPKTQVKATVENTYRTTIKWLQERHYKSIFFGNDFIQADVVINIWNSATKVNEGVMHYSVPFGKHLLCTKPKGTLECEPIL